MANHKIVVKDILNRIFKCTRCGEELNDMETFKLMECKPFPIQRCYDKDEFREIDWEIAEIAYKEYKAQYGNSQSLERLAERGGFGAQELVNLLYGYITRMSKK
ncbi:hypothetical protein LCGC14_0266900 [marine sediment metagenome]|uniref:Uncharacterized protein n=1 Tax=marine sediment metagenome TaxID=412755 RepID=A0A0F9U4J0_9ZZZZ